MHVTAPIWRTVASKIPYLRCKMSTIEPWSPPRHTACLALADGLVLRGFGAGSPGLAAGELCFNTAITGYQEILTDPSYAGQIIVFTFPHIGNVGANPDDDETVAEAARTAARGCVLRAPITAPQNWRARELLSDWLAARGIVAITGVDTRALTSRIRERGMINCAVQYAPDGVLDPDAALAAARAAPSMEGAELATGVSTATERRWTEGTWRISGQSTAPGGGPKIAALDYGIKGNILRLLADRGAEVAVLPANATAEEVLATGAEGLFLSNGPGDPGATAAIVGPTVRALLEKKLPTFGICLGHQLLGLCVGASTVKMRHGHHGANHPVLDIDHGTVSIVSMNHGFAVDGETLPQNARETHRSLFDGSNCGMQLTDRPAFSVQYHPEASPGPHDSHGLFDRFLDMVREAKLSAVR